MTHSLPTPNDPFWLTLSDKCVLVVGAGQTGQSVIRFLNSRHCSVFLWDSRETIKLEPTLTVTWQGVGESAQIPWDRIEGVVVSPGVSPRHPNLEHAFTRQIPIIGDVELFALTLNAREDKPTLVGITGSNGKTTVTRLIEHIVHCSGQSVISAGNIGTPVLDLLLSSKDQLPSVIILELSSFQLEMCASLQLDIGCFLNFSEDHLDRHQSVSAYANAKQRIYLNAKTAVYWQEQSLTQPPDGQVNKRISFGLNTHSHCEWWYDSDLGIRSKNGVAIDISKSRLAGFHNVLNSLACAAIADELGIDKSDIESAIATFSPLPHRCTKVSFAKGIEWIDDSKATNPGATLAALEGIGPTLCGKLILIAGGDAKGADLNVLKSALHTFVSTTIAIGKDADLFRHLSPSLVRVDSMEMAVKMALDLAKSGDTVLLSPACASIDMFTNYIHRAQVYTESIERWTA
jgi:UDP-N-acetylmuramoylalanine--D-glutamate ligase